MTKFIFIILKREGTDKVKLPLVHPTDGYEPIGHVVAVVSHRLEVVSFTVSSCEISVTSKSWGFLLPLLMIC